MKWAHYIKYKVKAVLVLLAIIIAMLIANLSNRNNFDKLDDAVISIYNDRLMPSTFIFRLTDHLYQKQLLLNTEMVNPTASGNDSFYAQHDRDITKFISDYESTYLTSAERKLWWSFKNNLEQYNVAYKTSVKQLQGDARPVTVNPLLHEHFNKAIQNLNALSAIQASEGKNLSRSSRDMISDGVLMSHFEVSLLLILGIFALILVSATDKNSLFDQQKHLLN